MPTKEEIMERMFSGIPDTYDKSEGSFIYDAVVAVSIALEDGYLEMEANLDKYFVDTTYGEYLDRRASDYGVYRKPATFASTTLTITGTDGTLIPADTRFYSDTVYFKSLTPATISGGSITVSVVCELEGTLGNVPANTITNLEQAIVGVTSVTNVNPVTNGTDAESDELLKERVYAVIQTPSTSGNVQDYLNWCNEVVGVGAAKVLPLWNGNGSVKCVLVNSNMRAADAALITAVQDHVEVERPIGAVVTYVSATELAINVTVDVTLAEGYDLPTVTPNITDEMTAYLKTIAFVSSTVSYAAIGSKILDTEGVLDYQNLSVNSGTVNISVANTEIPVVGTINVT
jgi:uncharacterized phage protein gp47/JayE